MNFREIENTLAQLKKCPKCNSGEGFWLGVKSDRAYAQCKSCGTNFEFFEVFNLSMKRETSKMSKLLRR